MNDDRQIQRFEPFMMNAYQAGQQLASQLYGQEPSVYLSRREVHVIQREAHIINGETVIREQEFQLIEEEETGPYWNDTETRRPVRQPSWISRLFGELK